MSKRHVSLTAAGAAVLAGLGLGLAAELGNAQKPRLAGIRLDRAVPQVALLDEEGRHTTLGAFRGRIVVLAPTLTLCHEVCPLTAGAFEQIQYDVARAGLSRQIAVVAVSVDPWRDSPTRLRSYRRQTGLRFHLLTGTKPGLTRFWATFSVGFFPTGRGRSFDVAHTDGVFLVDARQRVRIAIGGMPDVHGRLSERLSSLLSPEGRESLRHPRPGWDVAEVLGDLEQLTGRSIPALPLP